QVERAVERVERFDAPVELALALELLARAAGAMGDEERRNAALRRADSAAIATEWVALARTLAA
ncbi:MAG TPA: hypothetical protein VL400_08035, partial [Polyangiaceae bacterium]|nr:hypothetical protein [Polyangiaceae bacterium]